MPDVPPRAALAAASRMRIDDLLDEIPELVDLAGRMTSAGHEIALVGGSVRDAVLLGRHVDLDLATSAHPAADAGRARGLG